LTNLELIEFIALKMFFAVACGFVVGLERKIHGASAGFKTQILVCVGSMLFTVIPFLSDPAAASESARIIGQIVTGVGFLGAGAIMHGGGHGSGHGRDQVVGLTTAAWIWFTASIGILIGLGYGPAASFITLTLVMVVTGTRLIERKFFAKNKKTSFINTIEEKMKDAA
jgi:putative Mg2+ transporter-C (MgtC) family protein